MAAVVAIIVAAAFIWPDRLIAAIIISVIAGAFSASMVWSRAAGKWTSKMKEVAMPAICAHVGDLNYTPSGSAFSLGPMLDLKLLPEHDNAIRTSLLSGTHNGAAFQMVHAKLTFENNADNRRNNVTVFQGLLFHIDLNEPAPGRIVLMRDRGGIGNKLAEKFAFGSTRSLPKVAFDHAEFEAAFEVYAAKPEEAKAFMSNAMLDAMLQIGAEQGEGRGARAFVAGFQNRSFYMALEQHGTFMEMGGLTTPVADMESEMHGVFSDIALCQQVIDRLHVALGSVG